MLINAGKWFKIAKKFLSHHLAALGWTDEQAGIPA